ncbi:FBD-like protein, partial [Cynara cardunculus var. scolymus]
MYYNQKEAVSQTAMNLLDLQDYSNVNLDHLRELEITNMSSVKPELDFVKLILAKSPMLQKVGIVLDNQVAVASEVKMLRDLLQFQRASTKAEIALYVAHYLLKKMVIAHKTTSSRFRSELLKLDRASPNAK